MPSTKPNRRSHTVRQILLNSESFATTLITILIDQYAMNVLEWTPQTIRQELQQDFQVNVPQENIDKIMAAISLLTTDRFYQSLPTFIQLCNILSGDDFDPHVFDPATSAEMAWGITEAMLIYPPDTEEPFAEEIRYYIGEITARESIVKMPDVLAIGLRDASTVDPLAESADDPEMYSAMFDVQAASDDINAMLKSQLGELFIQLDSLNLQNGSTENLLQKMRKEIE